MSECADCDAAEKLAYSDATTPGFFSPKCAKHRKGTPSMTARETVEGFAYKCYFQYNAQTSGEIVASMASCAERWHASQSAVDPRLAMLQKAQEKFADSACEWADEKMKLENRLEASRDTCEQLQGAILVQNEREQEAGKRCGVPYEKSGCDWPDAVAEKLLETESTCKRLKDALWKAIRDHCEQGSHGTCNLCEDMREALRLAEAKK